MWLLHFLIFPNYKIWQHNVHFFLWIACLYCHTLKSALIVWNYVNESNYHTPLRNPILLTAMIVSTISIVLHRYDVHESCDYYIKYCLTTKYNNLMLVSSWLWITNWICNEWIICLHCHTPLRNSTVLLIPLIVSTYIKCIDIPSPCNYNNCVSLLLS